MDQTIIHHSGHIDEHIGGAAGAGVGARDGGQDDIGAAWHVLGTVTAQLLEPVAIEDVSYDAAACFAESLRISTEMGAEAKRARTLQAWARYEIERGIAHEARQCGRRRGKKFARLGMASEIEKKKDEK